MILRTLTLLLCLSATAAHAQLPQTLPPNSFVGRLGIGSGPGQAIPFSTLAALFASGRAIDVFLVIGDSNAVGQGSSASSPSPPAGTVFAYCADGTIVNVADPTCNAVTSAQNANTGSAWPAFGLTYYNATGKKVGLVLTGVSGSTQTAAADFGNGNWDSSGSLFTNASGALSAAMAAFTARGYQPTLRGIIVHLGANDALKINSSTITSGDYQTALTNMLARWRSTLSDPSLPIYYIQTGSNITGGVSDSGYSQVRVAQKTVTNSDPYTPLIFLNTFDFVTRGLMSSGAHPTQAGYNETGTITAANIVSGNSQKAFQRTNNYDLYWPHGNVAIGMPVANNLLSVNPNRYTAPKAADTESITHVSSLSPGIGASTFDGYGGLYALKLRSTGGTIETPTALPNASVIGSLLFYGYNGTAFPSASNAFFACASTELFTATANGTFCSIAVTPTGTTTKVTGFAVENDGGITLDRTVTGGSKGLGSLNAKAGVYDNGTRLVSSASVAGLMATAVTVNFNSAGDNAIAVPLPTGFTQLRGDSLIISSCSATAVGATYGLFTDVGGGGTALIAAGTNPTVSATTINTNNNMQFTGVTNNNTEAYTPVGGNLQFRVGTTTAASCKVTLHYRPIP